MLATTNVLVKTEDGREALAERRHDMQMRQRHLLILIDGARTAAQPFDPIAHFNRPLLDDDGDSVPAALSLIYDELPPLTGMTLGLQAVAAPIDEPAANDPSAPPAAPVQTFSVPQPAVPPELADVLPNVVKVELMRLAVQHFGSAAGAAMPLLRACKEDPQSLCEVVAACTKAAAPTAGEHAAAKFVDAAMRAMALRR